MRLYHDAVGTRQTQVGEKGRGSWTLGGAIAPQLHPSPHTISACCLVTEHKTAPCDEPGIVQGHLSSISAVLHRDTHRCRAAHNLTSTCDTTVRTHYPCAWAHARVPMPTLCRNLYEKAESHQAQSSLVPCHFTPHHHIATLPNKSSHSCLPCRKEVYWKPRRSSPTATCGVPRYKECLTCWGGEP